MKKIIITMLSGIILFGCAAGKKNNASMKTSKSSEEINAPLTETYWKLTELMGQPITATEANKKEMHIILKKENNLVTGHGGCNSFRGTYTILDGTFKLQFSQMAATLMACVNMDKEKTFMDVLQQTDNYAVKGNTLSLNKARMAPLAKFEAVLMK